MDSATPNRQILLVEPNAALRSAIVDVLAAEAYDVQPCETLEQALKYAERDGEPLALVAWQSMNGLLAEEHRHNLAALTRRLRLVLMVPRHWARMLDSADLGVAALVAKPFDADELLAVVRQATVRSSRSESPAGGVR